MAEPIRLEELVISSPAQTDALAKLLIEKGLITEQEYERKLSSQRKSYQRILKWIKESEAGSA